MGLVASLGVCLTLASVPRPLHAGAPASVGLRVEQLLTGERSGRSLWSLITGRVRRVDFVRPYGVDWSGGALLIADPSSGLVSRIDARGAWKTSPPGKLIGPISVTACPGLGPVVSDSQAGALWRLDSDLRPIELLARDLARPTTVLCDSERLLVVETAAHRILVLDHRGARIGAFGRRGTGPGEFNFPAAAALHGDDLWVGDTLNFRLQRLRSSDGLLLGVFGRLGDSAGETPRIKGIAVDGAGRVWVSDAFLDNVAVFSPAGELLIEVGGRGELAGRFSFPAGIAHHEDGRTAIADSLNRRVQVVRLTHLPDGGQR